MQVPKTRSFKAMVEFQQCSYSITTTTYQAVLELTTPPEISRMLCHALANISAICPTLLSTCFAPEDVAQMKSLHLQEMKEFLLRIAKHRVAAGQLDDCIQNILELKGKEQELKHVSSAVNNSEDRTVLQGSNANVGIVESTAKSDLIENQNTDPGTSDDHTGSAASQEEYIEEYTSQPLEDSAADTVISHTTDLHHEYYDVTEFKPEESGQISPAVESNTAGLGGGGHNSTLLFDNNGLVIDGPRENFQLESDNNEVALGTGLLHGSLINIDGHPVTGGRYQSDHDEEDQEDHHDISMAGHETEHDEQASQVVRSVQDYHVVDENVDDDDLEDSESDRRQDNDADDNVSVTHESSSLLSALPSGTSALQGGAVKYLSLGRASLSSASPAPTPEIVSHIVISLGVCHFYFMLCRLFVY
jgi:hypothetical protein